MEFLIISGLSGAGKSRATDVLEDLDYYCVDNMPVRLLPRFAELCLAAHGRYEKVALVTDIREREGFAELFPTLDQLWDMGLDYRIMFVEAAVPAIVKRYKETRRRHPLAADGGSVEAAVQHEIELLAPLRERADFVINTTNLTNAQLQRELLRFFGGDNSTRRMAVNVMSFGFKYGLPVEADLVFDVRFLPNPFYVDHLRDRTGMDDEVRDFVFSGEQAPTLMRHLTELLRFLLPQYVEEGKYTLTIAVGCTGGKHRSVSVARELTEVIRQLGHNAVLINRDAEK